MRNLIKILLALLLLIPSAAFATISVPWSITNLTDGFIFPNLVNGSAKGILVQASSTINSTLSVSSLTSGNCLQASTGGLLTTTGSACSSGSGTISTSSPLSAGLLVQSTGVSTIANIATSSLNLSTTDIIEGTKLFFTNARVIASTLTGYVSGAGTISSADTILTAIQKLNGNIAALVTGVSAVSGTYPIISSGSATPVISTAFGTTTSNTYAGTQTFTNTPVFSTIGAGTVNSLANGTIYNTATSTPTVSAPITYSGTLGQFIAGVSGAFGCTNASAGVTGCLTGTDWSTFNGKQAAGNYLTALTGDVTATGPGSAAATLATVNSNTGSFTNANFTVNGKGLITAASNGFSYLFPVSATSSPLSFTGLLTISNSSTTLASFNYASSTQYFGAGLASCSGASNALIWSAGLFGCNTISSGGSGFPFAADTNYGQVVYSTSTPTLWLKSGLFASSTSQFGNGTQGTGITVNGGATTTGNAYFAGIVNIGTTTTTNSQFLLTAEADAVNNTDIRTVNFNSQGTANFYTQNDIGNIFEFGMYGSAHGAVGPFLGNDAYQYTTAGNLDLVSGSTTGSIKFGSGGLNERMRLDPSGNLGIGTSSPAAKLTVASTVSADQNPALIIDGVTGGFNADMQLNRGSNTGTEEANIDFATAGVNNWQLGIQNNSTSDFELWDGSNDPVFTVKNGVNNIGFGTSTPFGDFAINADFGDVLPGNLIFNVASSTAIATTSVFQINNIGQMILPLLTGTQCLHEISGIVSGSGSDCGSGGGATFAYPFTPSTDGGIATSATTTPLEGAAIGLGLDVPVTSWYGIGGQLLAYASSTNQNTIFGLFTGGNTATTSATAKAFTAFGYKAGNTGVSTFATAIGAFAMQNEGANLSGSSDVAVGYEALDSPSPSSENSNTAIGYQVLDSVTAGSLNTGIGYQTLFKTTTGSNNFAGGYEALGNTATGPDNVAVGYESGFDNTGSTGDVDVGYEAGLINSSGIGYNTLLGFQAGDKLTSGADNIVLGAASTSANSNITTGTQNVIIGSNISAPVAAGSAQLDIQNIIFGTGNGAIGTTLSTGNIGIGTTTPWRKFSVNGTVGFAGLTTSGSSQTDNLCLSSTFEVISDTAACVVSAQRFKQNIDPLDTNATLNEVMKLQPVSFNYKPDFNGALQSNPNYSTEQVGFIADAVQKIDPRLVTVETATTSFEGTTYSPGTVQSVRYENMTALLAAAIQAQQNEIASLKPVAKSAEDNWQWFAIAILAFGFLYQQREIRKLKRK